MQRIVREITAGSSVDIDIKVQSSSSYLAIITQMIDDVFTNAYEVAQNVEPEADLTKEEKQAVSEYCMNSFYDINSFLLGTPDEDVSIKFVEKIKVIMPGSLSEYPEEAEVLLYYDEGY